METKKFMYYQDEDMFIGWLEDFPDYKTQGEALDELKENLKDIYEELTVHSCSRLKSPSRRSLHRKSSSPRSKPSRRWSPPIAN